MYLIYIMNSQLADSILCMINKILYIKKLANNPISSIQALFCYCKYFIFLFMFIYLECIRFESFLSSMLLLLPSLRKMGPGYGFDYSWDNSLYPPLGYRLGESCDFSVREYEWLLHQYIFCKYWAKLFCLANRHLSGQHGGVEVVACTRTTHSRDTVGGGSGALLVQGL